MKRTTNLQQDREAAELSIARLAELTKRAAENGLITKGVTERHIRRLERFVPKSVHDETWEALSFVLNVSVEKLTGPRGKDAPVAVPQVKEAAAAFVENENPDTLAALEAALAARRAADGAKLHNAASKAPNKPRPPTKRRRQAVGDSDAPRAR